jgi:hypothetical protein
MRKITLLFIAIIMASSFANAITGGTTGWYDDYLSINANGSGATSYWIGTSGTGTALQGVNFGSVSSLTINGCDMKYWSSNQERTGGSFFYKIMSANGATQIVAPVETIWDQAKLPAANDYQGTKATTINLLTGLMPGTTYELHVWAKHWGSALGDNYLSNSNGNYRATFTTPAVMVTGANGIANGTFYATLKDAFDAINLQTDQTGKDIEILIGASTTETASAILNQPSVASWNSLKIYPTNAGVTVSGNFANALIDLNGADKVTITGKLNKTGTPKSLTFMQQEATNSLSSTIRLINDAKNDTISYCTLKGSVQSSSSVGGIVYFATALTTTGTGNSDNVISYNDFTRAGTVSPLNAVYSNGTSAAVFNSKNTIDNNNFFGLYDGLSSQYGVKLGINNAEFTITNNSFYEPNEVVPTGTGNYYSINIGAGGPGEKFNISNNYIGGSEPKCAGLPFRKTNANSNIFIGLFVSVSSTALNNFSDIQGNHIQNINWKNSATKKDFTGIQSFGGNMYIGTTTANNISDIVLENGAISASIFYGIYVQNSTGSYTVQNNTISNITINNPDGANGTSFYGLYKSNSAGEVNFSDNIIGGATANSINVTGTSTANTQIVAGVYMLTGNNTSKVTISGNTIRNLNNSSNRTDVLNSTYGVFCSTANLNGSINNNKIYGLTASNTTLPARVIGVNMDVTSTSTAMNCYNNFISLGNSNPGIVYGILQNTGLGKVYNNTVLLAGTVTTGAFESAALRGSAGTTAGRDYKNNICYNTRSNNGATGTHYAVKIEQLTGLTIDANNYYVSGTGGVLGNLTTDCSTLASWKIATSQDVNSKSKDVEFVSTTDLSLTGTSINDAELGVARLTGVVDKDISGTTSRAGTTYMGAHEASDLTIPAPTKTFTVTVPSGTSKVYIAGTFTGKKWNITTPHELTATSNPNEFTGTFACTNDVTYKYLCDTGDFAYQAAVSAGGAAEANRTYNAADPAVVAWLNMKTVTLNVSFATGVPTKLFVKGSWDNFAAPIELTKTDNTFSTTLSGLLANKIPSNTQYKYYTNDEIADNWESNADNSLRNNRWSIFPVMNDEIARFTTAIVSGVKNSVANVRIMPTASGIDVLLNGQSTVELLNVNGVLIEKTVANGFYSRKLDHGVYIIRIDGKATKFVK